MKNSSTLLHQFSRFAIVGFMGFLVDACTLDVLVEHYGASPYYGRFVSFLLAATTTWWFNRVLTFRSQRQVSVGEWGKYASLMTLGACVNIGVYCGVIWSAGSARLILWTALASGAVSGMSINFFTARWVLHRPV